MIHRRHGYRFNSQLTSRVFVRQELSGSRRERFNTEFLTNVRVIMHRMY